MEKRSHLCLARVYSRREAILQQNRLRHKAARRRGGSRAQPCQHQPAGPLVIVPTLACRHAFLFNVSLDLSRACLGKQIGFMSHWRREGQVCFRTGVRGTAAARADVEHCRACPAPRLQLQTEPSVKLLQPRDLEAGAARVELYIYYVSNGSSSSSLSMIVPSLSWQMIQSYRSPSKVHNIQKRVSSRLKGLPVELDISREDTVDVHLLRCPLRLAEVPVCPQRVHKRLLFDAVEVVDFGEHWVRLVDDSAYT